eukprot:CAMPEP_0171386632 /NCGR_PEP_ID=MMETSP0879-20121228/39591_1 /TAXON_ID=67004 /ORGANISM="Thalassiosira weissflogii, Strain CCMP1336" /LENGTH=485 /DNA_ID=CAMNT_0011898951 /DNA_START=39 /DNA_END=1493 /DNA_ORIENTATION=+
MTSSSSLSSPTKSIILATAPKLTSLLSAIGSSLILFKVVCSPKNRSQTMHRIMACISLVDILTSSAMFLGSIMIPRGTPSWFGDGTQPIFWAVGTKRTCDMAGYLGQLQVGGVLFNASLATYYLLTVYYGWNDVKLKKVEWLFYVIPFGYALATSTFAAATNMYGHVEWTCWILPEALFDDGLELTNIQRHFQMIQWLFLFGVVWLCILYVSIIFALLYKKMKRLERRMNRYSIYSVNVSRVSCEFQSSVASQVIAQEGEGELDDSTGSAARAVARMKFERAGSFETDSNVSNPVTDRQPQCSDALSNGAARSGSVPLRLTTIQSERLLIESIGNSNSNEVEPDEENAMDDAVENGGDQNALNKRCNNAIDSEFHTSDNQSVEKEGPAINENDERDGEANFVIFQPSDILPNQQKTHKRNTRASIIGMKGTIRRPGRRTTAVAERREASRSKKVAVQGMLYVVAFYITWFFPTMSRITDLVAGKN